MPKTEGKAHMQASAARKGAPKRVPGLTDWYVIQVMSGQEKAIVARIRAAITASGKTDLVQELFSPTYQVELLRGEVREERLLPGYVVAVTSDVEALARVLKGIPALTRLLGNEKMFISLDQSDVGWLQALTQRGERTVAMSEGYLDFEAGGRVVVTSGPLLGHEAEIVRVHRRRREATLKLRLLGREVEVKVGLKLIRHEKR